MKMFHSLEEQDAFEEYDSWDERKLIREIISLKAENEDLKKTIEELENDPTDEA